MNDEYISREAVVRYLKGYSEKECNSNSPYGMITSSVLNKVERALSEMPSADVQPVKHGMWIETHISLCKWIQEDEKEEGHSFYMAELKCSCCERYNAVTFALTLNKPDFCQLCGARMDGDEECQ